MIDTTKYTQLLILKRHWVLAVIVMLTVIAVVVPVSLGLPDLYRTDAKLIVRELSAPNQNGGGPSVSGLDTRLQIIKRDALSRRNLIDLINTQNLYPEVRRTASIDVVIDRVQKDIQFNTQMLPNGAQVTMSFTVGYIGDDPEMAAKVANQLADFWVQQNEAGRAKHVDTVAKQLKAQVDEVQKRLDDANTKVSTYIAGHRNQLPDSITTDTFELNRLNTQLTAQTQLQASLKNAKLTWATQLADEKQRAATVGSTPEETELATLQKEYDAARAKGETDISPNLRRLIPRMKVLEDKIASTGRAGGRGSSSKITALESNLADADKDLTAANAAVADLERRTSALQAQMDRIPARNPEFESLKSDATLARDQYDSAKKKYDQAVLDQKADQADDGEEFGIEDPARVPNVPYGPARLNLIIVGVFLAIIAGIGAAVLRDQLDTSFHTLEELRQFTAVPVIGSIPHITTTGQRARRTLVLAAGACVVLVALAGVGLGAYRYAQHHAGITRLVSR